MDARAPFPAGVNLALEGAPASPALADALAGDALTLTRESGHLAVLRSDSLCAAVLDGQDRLIHATPAWTAAAIRPDLALLRAVPAGQPVAADGEGPMPPLLLHAPPAVARGWALPPAVLAALARPDAALLVLAVQPLAAQDALEAAARALGLTGQQARVLAGVLKTGSIRSAAQALGLSYDTARGAVSDAMARVDVPRLPALLDRLTMLALGIWPQDDADKTALLGDMLGLSQRQAKLALALALGQTRAEAAAAIGISEAVAKKEIDQIFLISGVNSAPALVRRLAEARALAMLSRSAGGVVWAEEGLVPLRFVVRPDGRRIAVSDHGPAGAPPVLVVHSSMTTRHVAAPLLRALQGAGYRVLSIDRPGFGLSDMVDAPCPFEAAVDDFERVLDALKIDRVSIVTRGAAQFVLAAGRRLPDRLGRVVLINPDPPSAHSGDVGGVVSVIKTLFLRNPTLVAGFARLLASQYTPDKAATIIRRSVESSPPDRDFMADPANVADYYRASRATTTGRYQGYVAEQVAFATRAADAPLPGMPGWTVLLGEHDMIHDPARTAAYWRSVLPDADHRVLAGAGRFLALTHTPAVLAALAGLSTAD
jgi:pimeloyl-ACP methyl ester carboxylesterase/DNA-binding CsgD family transcriptional regulator